MTPSPPSGRSGNTSPAVVIAVLLEETSGIFETMDWADDEIAAASRRHPGHADVLFHAFTVLMPRAIGPGMTTEFLYRAHAQELLNRAAAGADLRPATAAETCLILAQVSQHAPMHAAGVGLYLRMWQAAFPEHPATAEHTEDLRHYEHLYGAQIDELEATVRRKAADPARQLGGIACRGVHHGRPVDCRFTTRSAP